MGKEIEPLLVPEKFIVFFHEEDDFEFHAIPISEIRVPSKKRCGGIDIYTSQSNDYYVLGNWVRNHKTKIMDIEEVVAMGWRPAFPSLFRGRASEGFLERYKESLKKMTFDQLVEEVYMFSFKRHSVFGD